jgi:hypothetical protein
MKKIELCTCCGEPVEVDTADEWDGTCGECNPADEDLISFFDIEDIYD